MSEATDILQLIDQDNGSTVTYKVTTTWYDGSTINDGHLDGDIFRKQGTTYYRKQIDPKVTLKIETINDLRNTNGYYEGQEVQLLGYYSSGDKAPLNYKFTVQNFNTLVDDGGSVIKTTKGSWIAQFKDRGFDISDFGASTTLPDNKSFIDRAIAFAESKGQKDKRWIIYWGKRDGDYKTSGGHVCKRYVDFRMSTPALVLNNVNGVTGFKIGEAIVGANAISNHTFNIKGEYTLGNNSPIQPPTGTYIGLILLNEYYSEITLDQITGFQVGCVLSGDRFGFSYNKLYLGLLADNNVSLKLFATNGGTANVGWVNENSFYGGSIRNNGTFVGSQVGVLFDSDSNYTNNSNKFHSPSFEGFVYNQYEGTTNEFVRAIDFKWGKGNTFYGCRFENSIDNAPISYMARESNASQWNTIFTTYGNQNADIENRGKGSYLTLDWQNKIDSMYNILESDRLTDHIGIVDGVFRLSNDLGFVIRSGANAGGIFENLVDSSAISIGENYVNITNSAIGCDIDMSGCVTKRTLQGQIYYKSGSTNYRVFVKLFKTGDIEYTTSEYNAALLQTGGTVLAAFGTNGCINVSSNLSQFYFNVPSDVVKVRLFFTGDRMQGISVKCLNPNATIINSTSKWNNAFSGNRKNRLSATSSSSVITLKHDIVNFPSTISAAFSIDIPDFNLCRGKVIDFVNNSNYVITLTGVIGSSSVYLLKAGERLTLYASGTNWGIQNSLANATTAITGIVKKVATADLVSTNTNDVTTPSDVYQILTNSGTVQALYNDDFNI